MFQKGVDEKNAAQKQMYHLNIHNMLLFYSYIGIFMHTRQKQPRNAPFDVREAICPINKSDRLHP
jgi:hypothetical protein